MAKVNLKSLEVCKRCTKEKADSVSMTIVTGNVNKKSVSGFCCTGQVGKSICGWKSMQKV